MNTDSSPTVFLDRDGVLTVEKSYVCSVNDLNIFPYTKECIEKIHKKGYLAIVLTNQSGIARGYYKEEALLEMNSYLQRMTGVDAIYYCPHYQQGIVERYMIECDCRKPDIGMIKQACSDFRIDLSRSYMVGDRASDVLCGKKAGIKTVLLESGYGSERLESNVSPDFVLKDLKEFERILETNLRE